MIENKGKQLAKAAMAKSNTINVQLTGTYNTEVAKFTSLINHFGVNYSGTNVTSSRIVNRESAWNGHLVDTNNPHSVDKADVGLGNVDNTSDSTKATQVGNPIKDALDLKQDIISGYTGNVTIVTGVDFVGQTTTTQTITVVDGIITGVS